MSKLKTFELVMELAILKSIGEQVFALIRESTDEELKRKVAELMTSRMKNGPNIRDMRTLPE